MATRIDNDVTLSHQDAQSVATMLGDYATQQAVQRYDLPALLSLLDDLYGRDNLRYGDDVEAVRAEALRQLDCEWTIPTLGATLMTTAREVRQAFWLTFCVEGKPREFYGKSQNELPADVRAAFVDYVDGLARDGTISERLAASVTL